MNKIAKQLLPYIVFILFAGIFAYMSVAGHNHFQTFGWDLGFFDQIIWKASIGDLTAYSTIAQENLLADHFQPVLYLMAPLYWIWADVRAILIAQAFLVSAAGLILFRMAVSVTNRTFFSLAIMVSYYLFAGTQWLMLNEFHQTAFLPLFLALFFNSLVQKKYSYLWLWIIGLIFTKEEFSLLVSALGFVCLLMFRMKKTGLLMIIGGAISFFLLISIIMPKLSVNGVYSHLDFGESGYTPSDVVWKTITDPVYFFSKMVNPTVKIKTVFDTFWAFGFLPLVSPVMLIPVAENFVTRFIYAGPQFTKWVNVNQHAAPLGVLMSVACIYASSYLTKHHKKLKVRKSSFWIILSLILIISSASQNILLHGPVNSFFKKQFHEDLTWMNNNYEVIKRVPRNVSVAASNSMLAHVSQREEIYLLPQGQDAEYILVDMKDGPNKFSPLKKEEMVTLLENLVRSGKYNVEYKKGEAILLKKNSVLPPVGSS